MKRLYQFVLRWLIGVSFAVLLLGLLTRWHGLSLGGGHTVQEPAVQLSQPLQERIDQIHTKHMPKTTEEVRDLALRITGQMLRFGLSHQQSLRFGLEPRQANCREYAAVYAAVFNRIASRRQVDAVAVVVRSHDPRVFGLRVPHSAFGDHDWVLIRPGNATPSESWYVDPSFDELWLGWNVEGNVRGSLPRQLQARFSAQ